MTAEQARALVHGDPDFIYSKRYNFSLAALKARHPGEVSDRVAAAVLMVTEDDVREAYERLVAKLRARMLAPDSL